MTGSKILIVDDELVIRDGLRRVLDANGFQSYTSSSGYEAVERLQEEKFHVVVTDLKMPGMSGLEVLNAIKILQPEVPVIIITGYSTVDTAVEAMKGGAFDYISKPFTPEQITEKVEKALEQRVIHMEQIRPEVTWQEGALDLFIGESEAMQNVYQRIRQVAPTDSTVLITGESGTGKELVARAIHLSSPRRKKPFIAVDCTALVENLLESELFGHVKGSFTGAVHTKTGLFKVADGGTLFLDEVANISLTTQAKLLRVIQERELTPIGGTTPLSIDIRLITATNTDLKELVRHNAFREDLFFRLNIIPIALPPLCERDGDLPLLVGYFLKQIAEDMGKDIRGISPAAMSILEGYSFPGNVRELENIIERAIVLASTNLIQPHDLEIQDFLPANQDGSFSTLDSIPDSADELKERKKHIREMAVKPLERAFLLKALERNGWNITKAAREVGMQRTNFQAMLKKQGISVRNKGIVIN